MLWSYLVASQKRVYTIEGRCSSGGRACYQVIGRLSWAACRSVLEQDTEPQIAPDVQLAPCMNASVNG